MNHQLANPVRRNSHQISGREALDNETLYRRAPSIFAREAHDSRSERLCLCPDHRHCGGPIKSQGT
ncbi:hypothetical protein OVA00_32585 [Ensifer sp. SL37]|nr:hypothetical protein [Ensifer sp. SL37]MCY1745065.1 hypothetical protein [Ensifer sp. SL37]